MGYINIHTHHFSNKKDTFEIINLYPYQDTEGYKNFSIGLHPWYIKNAENIDWAGKINQLINEKKAIAIGETGLDKICATDYDLQKEVFSKHIELSEKYKTPMIIHCVKAYSDILWYRKNFKVSTPWIMHGFFENQQIANELIKHGCYLSFGKEIFHPSKKVKSYLAELPIDKIFLETDDEPELTIEKVYKEVSVILKMTENDLKKQIYFNFERLFPGILENGQLAAED